MNYFRSVSSASMALAISLSASFSFAEPVDLTKESEMVGDVFGSERREDFIRRSSAILGNPADIPELEAQAANGEPRASYLMSKLYWYGIHFEQDQDKARDLAHQGQGFSEDAYLWNLSLQSESDDLSLDKWHDAAFRGVPEALYHLSQYYYAPGPAQDVDLGWFFLAKAATKGHLDATRQYIDRIREQRAGDTLMSLREEARGGSLEGLSSLADAYRDSGLIEPDGAKADLIDSIVEGFTPKAE